MLSKHALLEKHGWLLTVAILVVVSIGGIVEIAPLFYLESTIEKVRGMRPYSPLELAGRNVYVREGCYLCHSQQIRPLRDEVERYGHYSLAAESMYDHPFQWGSKRTGPDLARVGGKYSDAWHVQHLIDPRSIVPESVMPPYSFLMKNKINVERLELDLKANVAVGFPIQKKWWRKQRVTPRRRSIPSRLIMTHFWRATRKRKSVISTETQMRSPRWMRSSPICRCSEH